MIPANDHDLLVRLDEKFDALTTRMEEHCASSQRIHDRQCARLDILEAWKWKWVGAVTVLVVLVNVIVRLLLPR